MSEPQTQNTFEQWAIVEVMGHRRFSGLVTEQTIGGSSFVCVDVPEYQTESGEKFPAFTKLFGSGSIYCISPIAEDMARKLASEWRERPISVYDLPAEYRSTQPRLSVAEEPNHDYYDDDEDEDGI